MSCVCGWPERDCVIRATGNKPEDNPQLECGERDSKVGSVRDLAQAIADGNAFTDADAVRVARAYLDEGGETA